MNLIAPTRALLALLLCFPLFSLAQQQETVAGQLFLKLQNASTLDISFANRAPANNNPLFVLQQSFGLRSAHVPFRHPDANLQHTWLLEFDSTHKATQLMRVLNQLPEVEYAEPVPQVRSFLTPNDLSAPQWNLSLIQAELAWNVSTGNANVRVAVVDDAILTAHQDLAPVIWTNPAEIPGNGIDDDLNGFVDDVNGWDVAEGDNDPNPGPGATDNYFSHGTHCAGIVGAATDNGTGIASIGYNLSLVPVKIGLDATSGLSNSYLGVEYAIILGVDVISMSWGGYTSSQTYQNLFDLAYANNIVCVAAAANDNISSLAYPASYNHVISVGATAQNDTKATFSNYGSAIDVMAPGVSIYSCTAGSTSSYGLKQGTSMACPLVAGLAGLMRSYNPGLTVDEIETCLESTCVNIDAQNSAYVGQIGAGRIHAQQAMNCIKPISAAFSTGSTVICPADQVQFVDESSNNPTAWEWSFPGGTPATSTQQNLAVTYSSAGSYDVTLIVHNANGSDTLTQTNYISVETASATLSGDGTILQGNIHFLKVDFTGPGPWNFTYSDGTGNTTINGITYTPYYFSVSPSVATTYSGVNMSASGCAASANGTAVVTVLSPTTCNSVEGFQRSFGGTGDEDFYSLALTFDGGMVLVGSTTSWGAGGEDVYAIRLDECGNHLWSTCFGSTGDDRGVSITQLQDSGFAIGAYTAFGGGSWDMFVARLDQNGNLIWANNYGGGDADYPRDMRLMPDGTFLLTGVTNTPVFTTGLNEYLCIRIDPAGNVIWSNSYGTSALNEFLHYTEVTSDGGALLVGYQRTQNISLPYESFVVKINGAGVIEWAKSYHAGNQDLGMGIRETANGYLLLNRSNSFGAGGRDLNLTMLDFNGNVQWAQNYGTPGNEEPIDLVVNPDGGYYISMRTDYYGGDQDIILTKLDGNGAVEYSALYGGPGDENAAGIAQDMAIRADGSLIIGARTESFGAGGEDFLLIRTGTGGIISCDSTIVTVTAASGTMTATDHVLTTLSNTIVAANPLTQVAPTTTSETIECEVIGIPNCFQAETQQLVSEGNGNLQAALDNNDRFGAGLTTLGDLNGDGVDDMAVGAPGDDDGGTDRGAVYVLFMNADGSVQSHQKISATSGGFTGTTTSGGDFGVVLQRIADLDGNGVAELAVGEPASSDGAVNAGAVWLLFLQADGTVLSHQKISSTQGNLSATLAAGDAFGSDVANLGDVDGNGTPDIAVGAFGDDDAGANRGAAYVLFLNGNGTVNSEQKISSLSGGFTGGLDNNDNFGISVEGINDLNADGVPDVVVGAPNDDDGGTNRGAAWVLFLNNNGTVNSHSKISNTNGGFLDPMDDSDQLGYAISTLGDFDGDGVRDLAITAPGDDDGGTDRGAFYMVLMNDVGTVKSTFKVSQTEGNFSGTLIDSEPIGNAISTLGDLDGNGLKDIAISAELYNDGGADRGAAWVVFTEDPCDITLCQQPTFVRAYGTAEDEAFHDVIQTSDGHLVAAGIRQPASATTHDWLVVKTTSAGEVVWSQSIGLFDDENGLSMEIIETTDGGYAVAGYSSSFGTGDWDPLVVKLDVNGNILWQYRMTGGNTDQFRCMIEAANGDLVLGGSNTTYTAGGSSDFMLTRLASDGTLLWTSVYGDSGANHLVSLMELADGSFIGAGTSGTSSSDWSALTHFDATGTLDWVRYYDGPALDLAQSVALTPDGGFIIAGRTSSYGTGGFDVFVTKTTNDGAIEWTQVYGGVNDEFASEIQRAPGGGYYVYGYTSSFGSGQEDVFLLKISWNGTLDWASTFGAALVDVNDNWSSGITYTADNNIILAGSTTSIGSGGPDALLIKANECGETACWYSAVMPTTTSGSPTESTPTWASGTAGALVATTFTPDTVSLVTTVECDVTPPNFEPACSLTAAFTATSTCLGDATQFTNLSADNYGTIIYHEWHFGDGSSAYGNPNPEYTYVAPGSYEVTLVVGNDTTPACLDTVMHTVVVSTNLFASARTDTMICIDDSVALGPLSVSCGSAPFTYAWSPSASLNNAASPNPMASPAATTTYVVTVTDNLGATATDTVVVSINPNCCVTQPTYATNTPSYCRGDSMYITNTSAVSGSATYTWSFGPGATPASYSGQHPPAIYLDTIGAVTINLTINDSCGTYNLQQIVGVNTLPQPDIGTNSSACQGDTIQLGGPATGNWLYAWTPNANISDTSVAMPSVWPSTNTTYYVTATDPTTGCTGTDSILVTTGVASTIDAGNDTTICLSASVTLTASGATQYAWSTGDTAVSISVSPTTTTTYLVQQVDSGACPGLDSVTVTVDPGPTASAGNDVTICLTDTVVLYATGGSSYQWSTGAQEDSIIVFPTDTTTYTVMVADTGICTSSAQVTVNVVTAVVADAGPDTSVCVGSPITLIASGSTTYLWDNGTSNDSNTVSPIVPTMYYVTVTAGSCSGIDSVFVDTTSAISITVSADTAICPGTSATLHAAGGNDYAWSNGDSTASTTVSPTVATTYYVTASIGACAANDSVLVSLLPTPTADAGTDLSICLGDSTMLTASGGSGYLWSNADTTASTTVQPATATTYFVTVVSAAGCTATDSVVVSTETAPVPVLGADAMLCLGDSIALDAGPANTYLWSTAQTAQTITVVANSDTTIWVQASSAAGCAGSDTIFVATQVCCSLAAVIDSVPVELCANVPVQFSHSSTGASASATYMWAFDANAQPPGFTGSSPPAVRFPGAGTYTVVLILSDTCGSDTTTYDLTLVDAPTAAFTMSLHPSCEGILAEFFSDTTSWDSVAWYFSPPSAGTTPEAVVANPTQLYAYQSELYVMQVAHTAGCSDSIAAQQTLSDFETTFGFTAPNVFTPNSDGVNDYLEIGFNNKLFACTDLHVFNRWGNLMFTSLGNYHSWDGRTFDGQPAPAGQYYYVLSVNGLEFKGSVMLLR